MFWPSLVRFGEYVLREQSANASSVEGWQEQFAGDKSAVEAMLNHVHIIDLHLNGSVCSEAQLIDLGRTLKEISQAKLAVAFPGERFEVTFDDTPVSR